MSRKKHIVKRGLLRASAACAIEALESRVLLSTYMVTNRRDAGLGSLRDAIQMVNSNPGPNTIMFTVDGQITLTSGPLEISGDVSIMGLGPGVNPITISGNNQSRVFQIDAGAIVSMSYLQVIQGRAPDGVTLATGNGGPGSHGGGIYNLGNLTLTNDGVSFCTAGTGGPGLNGGPGGNGGGIFSAGSLTVLQTSFGSNYAGTGGAGEVTPNQGIGGTGGNGGAIYIAAGQAVIGDSVFRLNGSGGGGHAYFGANPGSGGAIATAPGTQLIAVNSVMILNSAGTSAGGGIENSGEMRLTNDTVSANSAVSGGGLASNGNSLLNNTIVAGNAYISPYMNPPIASDVQGMLNSASAYNLIGDGGSGGLKNGVNGNIVGVADPKLSPDGFYAPLPGSPAIDAGSNALAVGPDGTPLTTDERGMSRIVDATHTGTPRVDIGAFEAPPFPTTLVVSNTADTLNPDYSAGNLSLRDAIGIADALHGPQQITFAPGVSGVISLNASLGPLEINNPNAVTIHGPGAASVSVNGQNATIVLLVDAGAKVEFDSIQLTSGRPKSVDNRGTLSLADCILNGAVSNIGNLTFTNCTYHGGNNFGISNNGTLALLASTFASALTNSSTLNASNSTFSGPITNNGTGTLDGCSVAGGGISNSGVLNLTGCVIANNTSGSGVNNIGTATLTNCTISGNLAQAGAGVDNGAAARLVMVGCTLTGNTAGNLKPPYNSAAGGGIENLGIATLFDCTISENTTTAAYGAFADVSGGGIDNSGGTLTLVNCTITNNLATIGNYNGNTAAGGGIYIAAGHVILNNTLLAANRSKVPGLGINPGPIVPDDVQGAIDSTSAYNLIGDGDGSTGLSPSNHNQIGTAANPIDPKVMALGYDGGPTWTVPLLAGSPAIDAGSNALALGPDGKPLLTDQRGYYRIFNGTVDIGAYEYGSSPLLAGDANADGKVDFTDLVIVARNYGKLNATWSDGDFNNDGSVGFDDLLIVARNYGKSLAAAAVFAASQVKANSHLSP